MPQCPECGARNSDSSTFCIRCGMQFGDAPAEPSAPTETTTPSRVLDEAAELYAAGNLDDAAAACHAALDEDPDLVSARSLLGMIEEDRGNLAAALAEYEAVLRLAPERTAERERADRLRAAVRAQTASAIPEDEQDRRRWLPLVIAVAAALLVLVIGSILLAGRGGSSGPGRADLPPGQALPGPGPAVETPPPGAEQPSALALDVGGGPLAGKPIGPAPKDQSDRQPQRQRPGYPSATDSATPPPDTTVMPPPTIDDGPLELPQPAETPSTSSLTGTQPASPMQPPRGKVRIWMGEETGPAAVSSSATGGPGSGTDASTIDSAARQRNRRPASAPSSSSSPAITERSRTARGADTRRAATTSARSATGSGAPLSPRTGSEVTAAGSQSRPVAAERTSGYGAPTRLTTDAATARSRSPSTPRHASGATVRPAPTRRSGPGSAGASAAGASGPASGSPSDLRSRAQQARTAGRNDEARGMYRSAIEGYKADARRNPSRAAANRSAIESCERALQTMDASR